MRKSNTTTSQKEKHKKKHHREDTSRSAAKRVGEQGKLVELQEQNENLGRRNDELEDQNKNLEDRLLRLAAEFENYKKRTAREFRQVVETANRDLILQLIDVLDNFQRALESANSAKDFDAFHQGIELIYSHLNEILTRQGLEPIEAVGQPFDPHRHEAVMQVDDPEHPPDTVVDQMQTGYLLKDTLLRPSRVVVSRGPGKKEPSTRGSG
jgi:molecular chaperone GrpE